jgi:protein-S-isoprenylcysteine O-methyltransferase Ste14
LRVKFVCPGLLASTPYPPVADVSRDFHPTWGAVAFVVLMRMSTLHQKAFGGLLILFLVMASVLFLAAGTLDYWQAWTFLTVYFAACFAITIYLMKKDPKLLQRRMSGGPFAEKEPTQRIIMSFASLGFIGLLVVPALDHRFAWSPMPPCVALAGDVLLGLGWLAIFFVFRANTFSSATIELATDQKVVSTGPYALVRHPMYAGALGMLLGMPIALGSWWGLLVIAAILPALIWRLLDEENFLARNLPGYVEYQSKVRYRLMPRV